MPQKLYPPLRCLHRRQGERWAIASTMDGNTNLLQRWITLKKIKYIDQEGKEVWNNFRLWSLTDRPWRDCGSVQSEKPADQQEWMVCIHVPIFQICSILYSCCRVYYPAFENQCLSCIHCRDWTVQTTNWKIYHWYEGPVSSCACLSLRLGS